MEALEYQLTLLVLVLSDAVFALQLVQLHRLAAFQRRVFRMEHVRAQVQHGLLVDLQRLVVGRADLRVVLHELADAVHEAALLDLPPEVVLAQVRQRDQDVHQHRHRDLLADQLQQALHDLVSRAYPGGLVGVHLQVQDGGRRVDHVRQHGRREVQAEHVDLGGQRRPHQVDHPPDHVVLHVGGDDGVFDGALLQDGHAEALRDAAVLLLFQDLRQASLRRWSSPPRPCCRRG